MAITTYDELISALITWATWIDDETQIPDFITWADQEIGSRLRANFMLSSADVAVSGETASQPADFLAIRRMYLDVSPRVRLGVVDATTASDLCAENGTGSYPSSVAVEGSNFHFAPLYSTATTGKLLYYARPPVLSASNATNIVLTKYPYLYVFGALEALFRYKEDDNNADRYGAQFGGLIEQVNALEAKDAMSGPLQMTPFSGNIA